jgi:hypothetical protein
LGAVYIRFVIEFVFILLVKFDNLAAKIVQNFDLAKEMRINFHF